MLVVLFILGTFCPLNFAALDISLLDPQSDKVLTAIFSDAFLLRFPNCTAYGGKQAEVLYQKINADKNETKPFTVPMCNKKEESLGLLLNQLKNGTKYSMWYKIGDSLSSALTDTTQTVTDFSQINDGLPARSGAMVVITVILVLAMVGLLAGIIFLQFFSA